MSASHPRPVPDASASGWWPPGAEVREPLSPGSLAALPIEPDAIGSLPKEFVQRHRVLPIHLADGLLTIATANPGNDRLSDDIRLLTGLEVTERQAPEGEITERIAECYQVTVERMIENFDPSHGTGAEAKNLHDIEVMANEPTVVNLVNLIIATALRERASDIHLLPFENSLQLRYRIDGLLQENSPPPKPLHAALVSRIKIMADMNIAERFLPKTAISRSTTVAPAWIFAWAPCPTSTAKAWSCACWSRTRSSNTLGNSAWGRSGLICWSI